MHKHLVGFALGSCLSAAAPAAATVFSFTVNGFNVSAHGVVSCTFYDPSECDGNTATGWIKDKIAYGDTSYHLITGLTLDFGTTDIVSPFRALDFAFPVDGDDDGNPDRGYRLVAENQFDISTGLFDIPGFTLYRDSPFLPQAVVVNIAPTPAPEAATWAMMVMGFGLAGCGLRRSRIHLAFA